MAVIERIQARHSALADVKELAELQKAVTYMVSNTHMPDLTQRQLGTLLLLGCSPGPHTIRGIAAALGVHRPAATRAVDVLEGEGLALRLPDPTDRRSVHVVPTAKAHAFLSNLGETMRPSAPVRMQAHA